MTTENPPIDAPALRRWLALGGLAISEARAGQVLPLAAGLLAAGDRLVPLELSASGGSGPEDPPASAR